MQHRTQHSHCSYCGTRYEAEIAWPRDCGGCGETTWLNPLPVAVVLLPVDTADGRHGLVVCRRAIPPALGELCLPGGFIEVGESWQEAGVRELREETGLLADPADVRLFDAHSLHNGMLLVFGVLPVRNGADLPPSAPTEEATEWLVVTEAGQLAFETHERVVVDYFASA
jgi:ADP-ribose pyrophosphatase YjhB (NUDIX family)